MPVTNSLLSAAALPTAAHSTSSRQSPSPPQFVAGCSRLQAQAMRCRQATRPTLEMLLGTGAPATGLATTRMTPCDCPLRSTSAVLDLQAPRRWPCRSSSATPTRIRLHRILLTPPAATGTDAPSSCEFDKEAIGRVHASPSADTQFAAHYSCLASLASCKSCTGRCGEPEIKSVHVKCKLSISSMHVVSQNHD